MFLLFASSTPLHLYTINSYIQCKQIIDIYIYIYFKYIDIFFIDIFFNRCTYILNSFNDVLDKKRLLNSFFKQF